MKDLIYRQAAIDAIRNIRATTGTHDDEVLLIDKAEAQTELMLLPSAERKKGHWISLDDFRGRYNEYGYKCSECGEQCDYEENYCPMCGVDMRGDNDG